MKIKRSGRSRPKNEETGGGCAKTLALRLCCGYSGEGGGRRGQRGILRAREQRGGT